jgi:endonuclease G, mitochondrial
MLKQRFLYPLILILLLFGCKETEIVPDTSLTEDGTHLLLGNPSNATADVSNFNNYLIERQQYTLSYSKDRGTPNWVSWYVSKDWLGSVPRQDDFRADQTLPTGWYIVLPSSYTNSGFDRGHNIPSADRTKTVNDNSSTFLMTNMIPQAPNHNRQTWANLEDYTRDLVQAGMEVYVVMGSYGSGGTGSNGVKQSIDQERVTVPSMIWKVLVILPEGVNDLSRINSTTRVIAVNSPNINSISSDWGIYRTSVDNIEQATGYDLLSAIPDQIENALESKVDTGPVK